MENIYFQPTKENSEFLAKLEKLDEYTIPQILERMVDCPAPTNWTSLRVSIVS